MMDSYGFATKLDGFMFFSNESKWTFQQRRLQTSGCLKSGETYSKKDHVVCWLIEKRMRCPMSFRIPPDPGCNEQKCPSESRNQMACHRCRVFLLPQDSRFLMLSTHVFKKKPGQLELQMGDWY
jgi:hypothetical protein